MSSKNMKRWKKYDSHRLTGDWHVHTNFTDGKDSVFANCIQAEKNGLSLIAFTEHVRKELDYDFEDFVSNVYSAKDKFDLEVLIGCEAKVIDIEGNLDVTEKVLKECEVVLGVFHSFEPSTKESYLKALKNMLFNDEVDVWAHPTLYAIRKNILLNETDYRLIANLCSRNEILIEKNKKHNVPDTIFLEIALDLNCKLVNGSDAHKKGDLLERIEKVVI